MHFTRFPLPLQGLMNKIKMKGYGLRKVGLLAVLFLGALTTAVAQELQVKININTQQVGTSDKSVFENLQQTLEQWMNDRQWTDLQFQQNERIV